MLWCALSIFFVLNILSCRLCIRSVRSSLSVRFCSVSLSVFLRCSGPVRSVCVHCAVLCIASISLWNVINKVISSGNRRKPHDLISYQHKYGINILPSRARTAHKTDSSKIDGQRCTQEKKSKKEGKKKKPSTHEFKLLVRYWNDRKFIVYKSI